MIKHYLTVFLISMVPIAELRAAIPYSQAVGLPLIPSYIIAIIGNMIPVPFIYLFARKVLEIGNDMPGIIGKFCRWLYGKGQKAERNFRQQQEGDFCCVTFDRRIPLPGTGAWTGTLAASFLKMDFKSSAIAAMCGVLLAGVIMMTLSAGFYIDSLDKRSNVGDETVRKFFRWNIRF
ncbi:MAG: COG2426 family protein [Anaerobutyricum sp.]